MSTPITPDVITVDGTVLQYNQYVAQNQPTTSQLQIDKRKYVEQILLDVFGYYKLQRLLNYVVRLMDEHATREFPIRVSRAKTMAEAVMQHLTVVGSNFGNQIHQLMPLADDYLHNPQLQERVNKGVVYFLDKTAELMQEFIDQGCPPIGNQTFFEQMDREFDALKVEYNTKMQCFTRFVKSGFSLDEYWNAKAVAQMTEDTTPKVKRERKPRKSKEQPTEDAMFAMDDIAIDPEEQLRQMRNKAIRRSYAIARSKAKK